MQQNTDDWLAWRKKGIGASDCPIIMGVSPWKTPFQLWQEKTGITKNDQANFATFRGSALESDALEHYELHTGNKAEPITLEMEDAPWMRASLDGWVPEKKTVVEIKCPGKDTHEEAKGGSVPIHYWWQMQHQMLVANADLAHYWSFDGESGCLVEVKPDKHAQETLFDQCRSFWVMVEDRVPPKLTNKDKVDDDSDRLVQLVKAWRQTKRDLEDLKKAEDGLKTTITKLVGHDNVICDGVQIQRIERAGAVDYKKIPELKGVDLDQYRKKPTSFWKLTDKKKED